METIKEDKPVENKVVSESTIEQNGEKERMNYGKVIVFAFTGDTFSFKFMQCWMEMFNFCIDNGIKPLMSFLLVKRTYMFSETFYLVET